jgi:hypothetical protein
MLAKANSGRLVDYLVGSKWKCRRDIPPERLGCPKVDHQFKLDRLLHRKITRLSTSQNTIDVRCSLHGYDAASFGLRTSSVKQL